ncbi:hypothetical protein ACQQ9V_06680 [Hornefia butyriciproducens]|uniref:hypothetical protein n=1 Tax=Hornefia butyriciproducens TaxID=2652293 RepID=UPI003CFCABF0
MREKEFMEMAKQEILRQLPEDVRAGLSLKEVEVVKINDQKNHGFCFQKDGSKAYAHILSMYYLGKFQYTEAEMMEELNLERSSYYRRKKEAVIVFGLAIWGGSIDDLRQIMLGGKPQQMTFEEMARSYQKV